MSDRVKVSLIIVIGLILVAGLYLYFSPYQQCVRAKTVMTENLTGSHEWSERFAQSECGSR